MKLTSDFMARYFNLATVVLEAFYAKQGLKSEQEFYQRLIERLK